MLDKINQLVDALDERTGLPSGIKHFLYEEIPASSGWHQVFGSVALFLFASGVYRGTTVFQLCAHAGRSLQQPEIHYHRTYGRAADSGASSLGRKPHDCDCLLAHDAGIPLWSV